MLHRTNSFSCFQIVSLFRCTITHRFAKWYEITLLSNIAPAQLKLDIVLLPYEIRLLSNDTGTLTANIIVLLPYEITLLSNDCSGEFLARRVLLPYEITLLSNRRALVLIIDLVLLPYEITLLSNSVCRLDYYAVFYYLMKLHYSQTHSGGCLK